MSFCLVICWLMNIHDHCVRIDDQYNIHIYIYICSNTISQYFQNHSLSDLTLIKLEGTIEGFPKISKAP